MTPVHVTPDQIAEVSGLTHAWVRKKVIEAAVAGGGATWKGAHLRVVQEAEVMRVEFASLPADIREAFVMRDQLDLPLPPPVTILFLNDQPARPLH